LKKVRNTGEKAPRCSGGQVGHGARKIGAPTLEASARGTRKPLISRAIPGLHDTFVTAWHLACDGPVALAGNAVFPNFREAHPSSARCGAISAIALA